MTTDLVYLPTAPPQESERTLRRAKQILRKAARIIRRQPRIVRGRISDQRGGFCATGAIIEATRRLHYDYDAKIQARSLALHEAVSRSANSIPYFNDYIAKSKHDVADLLEAAAA